MYVTVEGIDIEFRPWLLNDILGIPNEGLEIYFAKKAFHFSNYSHVDVIRNICHRFDFSDGFVTSIFVLSAYVSSREFYCALFSPSLLFLTQGMWMSPLIMMLPSSITFLDVDLLI